MDTGNSWWYFTEALTPEQCQDIVDLGELVVSARGKKDGVVDGWEDNRNHKPILNKKYRNCEVGWFNDRWVYDLIFPFVHRANESAGWNYKWDFGESFQYTMYPKGGFYKWHTDQGMSCNMGRYVWDEENMGEIPTTHSPIAPCITHNPTNEIQLHGKIRKLSLTLNLDEPEAYSGGELEFDIGARAKNRFQTIDEIKPQGSLVVFPSYTYHQVKKVTKGNRRSLVLWCCGEPYR